MSKMNSLLSQRFKQATEKLTKMTSLAERSRNGELSSFSGVFKVSSLTEKEKNSLEEILTQFRTEHNNVEEDLDSLAAITSEVKAINNQAVILHGERIKRAQEILKTYKDGAFTAWLLVSYGNRQTPYNFLQYYEFYKSVPTHLLEKLDEMPRQAVYTLASRSGAIEEKHEVLETYAGQPKQEILSLIRKKFPLPETDKRAQDLSAVAITTLAKLEKMLIEHPVKPTEKQRKALITLLNSLQNLVERK